MKKIYIFLLLFFSYTFIIQAQVDVHFMTFNVWQEGTSVPNGLTKIRDVIVKTNPDIIGFTEVRNYNGQDWTTKIVNELSAVGKMYYRGYAGGDISLISKYPILSSAMIGTAAAGFNINIKNNTIIVAITHLDYTHYACYLPRGYNGGTPDWNMIDDGNGNPKPVTNVNTVLAYNLDSDRDEQIAAYVNFAKTKSLPLVLMGDFNEPSHLDWTAKTTAMFDHNGLIIPWHTTLTLKNNGFTDAYREFFPDEKLNPGISWPSYAHEKSSTSWTPKSDERDRIDFIFHKGTNIKTKYVALVGPKESYVKNVVSTANTSNENFMADNLPWPSDHKAVFATITFPFSTVGMQEETAAQFSVYPNPAHGKISITNSETIEQAWLIDTKGALHQLDKVADAYDISGFRTGIYVLQLILKEQVVTSKLIID
jgi:endonuclease/exonuclease/phosphatase family metal-dependent hydrolase